MKLSNPKNSSLIDICIERQWHIGIHATALIKMGVLGKIYGGFPQYRYCDLGIPKSFLRTNAWATCWNEICHRFLGSRFEVNHLKILAKSIARRSDLNRYIEVYGSLYRYLFPLLKNRDHILMIERGSTHPEYFFHQIEKGKREAGFGFKTKLPKDFEDEIEASKEAHFIVAGSKLIKESYTHRGYDAEKILYIPYGVDHQKFSYQKRTLPSHRPLRIACVGFLGIRKGLKRLLLIAEWAKKRKIDCELRLIGPLENEAHSLLSATSARYRLLGIKKGEELVQALHQCDLYCLASYEEGFGISVLEAMSTGLPVIISDETGAKEAITDGKDGLVLKTFSEEEFDKELLPLFKNGELRLEMGYAARQKIEEHYTIQHYSDALNSEYKRMFQLVENSRGKLSPAWRGSS